MCANHVKPTHVQSFQELSGHIESDVFTVGSLYASTIMCVNHVKPTLVQSFQKAVGMLRKLLIYSWERLPREILAKSCLKRVTSIKQIRVFVEFENRPRPLINIERDESSQTHLTVSTTLRSFRDKIIHTETE